MGDSNSVSTNTETNRQI